MPSFDASSAAAATVPRPVDVDRIHECVKRLGLRYFIDDEGDIGIPWRYVTVHAIFQDTRAVQMRGIWHRIGPKAYLTVADGGVVRLHGEYTYPLEAGMTDRQLEDFVFGGCRLIVALMHEAEEQFPDELRGSLEP